MAGVCVPECNTPYLHYPAWENSKRHSCRKAASLADALHSMQNKRYLQGHYYRLPGVRDGTCHMMQ